MDRHKESLATLARLWVGVEPLVKRLREEAACIAEMQLDRGQRAVGDAIEARGVSDLNSPSARPNEWEEKAAQLKPHRLYRGPIAFRGPMRKLPREDQEAWQNLINSRPAGGYTLPVLAEYWADGRRTALEIVDLVEMESGIRDAELVVKRFKLLHKLGLVDLGQ